MRVGDACVLIYDADLGHTADDNLLRRTVLADLLDCPEFLEDKFTVVFGDD